MPAVNPGARKGVLPSIFSGDKKLYQAWRTELKLYQLVNYLNPSIQDNYERVLDTLGFIKGPAVATWVEEQMGDLEQNAAQWGTNDPLLWSKFMQNIDRAFSNVLNKEVAVNQLVSLHQDKNDLDAYNTEFNSLI